TPVGVPADVRDIHRVYESPPVPRRRPTDRPSRCAQTNADTNATRCPDPATDTPPALAAPNPSACPCDWGADVAPKNGPAPTAPKVDWPASNPPTAAAGGAKAGLSESARRPGRPPRRSAPPGTTPPCAGGLGPPRKSRSSYAMPLVDRR